MKFLPLKVLAFSALAAAVGMYSASAPAAPAPVPAKLIPLKVAYDGYSMTTAPMNYAVQKGIFKKHGLDVTITYVDAGTTLTQAVVGGSVGIAQNGYTPAAAAAVQGADIVFIGGISNQLPFQLVVKDNIRSAADLKGKKIAISRIGSSTDIAATYALRHLGLNRSDVAILQLGGEGTRTAAMMTGQIDASLEQYPRTGELVAKGYRVLVDCLEIAVDYPNTSYVSTRAFIQKNPDVVKRFLMGISEGIHEFRKNKDESLRFTASFLKSAPGPDLDKAFDVFTTRVYPDIPRPSLKGIGIVLNEMKTRVPKAGQVTPESLIYTQPFDELEKEGFFAKLK